jgi:hypothetical protein
VALYDPKLVCSTALSSYWASQGLVAGTTVTGQSDPTLIGCAVCTIHMSRTSPVGIRDDLAAYSFHIAKVAGSDRQTPSIADLATIEPFLTTWLTTIFTLTADAWSKADITYHLRNAAALRDGPSVKRTALVGTGGVPTSRMPDQDSATMTIAGPSRKHWGRVYLPGIAQSKNDVAYGRIVGATCTAIATAGNALATSLDGASFALGTWSKIGLAFLDVYGIHVDDVWDIQRRRRAKQRSFIAVQGH